MCARHTAAVGTAFWLLCSALQVSAASNFTVSDWMSLEQQRKLPIIERVIGTAKDHGIHIVQPASYYVGRLDDYSRHMIESGDPSQTASSLGQLFKMVAAMDGDWDDGRPRLEVLKEALSPKGAEEFKHREPERYERLADLDAKSPRMPSPMPPQSPAPK